MATADLHLVHNCALSPNAVQDRQDDSDPVRDARGNMPLALLQHCPQMPDQRSAENLHMSRADVVDYSSNAQQSKPTADDDEDIRVCHDLATNSIGGASSSSSSSSSTMSASASSSMPVPMTIKVERDGDGANSPVPDDDDGRRGLSAFCEALYSSTGPPQGFVVNPTNMSNLPPDAKPVLAMMAAAAAPPAPVVPVKKRRRRRKLKQNGELAPGEEHFPYRCDVCEKGLRSLAALKYHERIHSGEKPYECGTCGRRFAVSNHLRYHERAHTGEKPFRCSVCAKGFTSNFNLKYHEQIHAGIKPHVCDFCGKKYRSKAGLTGHQMKKGHHERFQNMMRDGYFLDGHGPSFGNPSSAGSDIKDERPDSSTPPSSVSGGPSGDGMGGGEGSSSDAAPKPKRRGPGRPPTLVSRTRQLQQSSMSQQQIPPLVAHNHQHPQPPPPQPQHAPPLSASLPNQPAREGPNGDQMQPQQQPQQQQQQQQQQPQQQQQMQNNRESDAPSPNYRQMQHPTPSASPVMQQQQRLQQPPPPSSQQQPQQQQLQQPSMPPVYSMMNMNHQMANGRLAPPGTPTHSLGGPNPMSMFAQSQSAGNFIGMPPGSDPRYFAAPGAFMPPGPHGNGVGVGMGQIDGQQRFLAGMRPPQLHLHPGHQPMHHQPWESFDARTDDFRNRTSINYAGKKL